MNTRKAIYLGAASLFFAAIATVIFSYYMLVRLVGRKHDVAARWASVAAQVYRELRAEPITFLTDDGVQLAGRLVVRRQAQGTVIFCHGFHRTKERMAHFAHLFPHHNLLFFDFRACGESAGEFSSIGHHEYRDVRAAVRFARRHNLARPVFLFGVSMGAVAALKAVRRTPGLADGLILDSPYANLREEIEHIFSTVSSLPSVPFLPIMTAMFAWLLGRDVIEMHPEDEIEHLDLPILLIHSASDSFTLPNHSVRLYAKAGECNKKARLWIGPPAKHGHLYDQYPEYYAYKIKKFLKKAQSWLRDALSRDIVWHAD